MLMVLLVHADGASVGLPQAASKGIETGADIWRLSVESLVIIGVNCFTIISGYFGINLRGRSVALYLFQCVFYAVSIASIAWALYPDNYGAQYWCTSWLVLTHTQLWYVPAYFILMLLSPLINAGANQLSRTKFTALTLIFVIVNIWCGWWWSGKFNPTGYTVVQLIMMYMAGRTLAMYRRPEAKSTCLFAGLYLLFAAGVFVSSLYLPNLKAFAYNSPLVMAESVALFLTFLSLRFKSKKVNFLAKSAFAVYLVHKADFVWMRVFKPLTVMHWDKLTLAEFSIYILVGSMAVYILIVPIDILRRWIWSKILLITDFLMQKRVFSKLRLK